MTVEPLPAVPEPAEPAEREVVADEPAEPEVVAERAAPARPAPLPSPELIEQRRRSVAMLRPGVWAFRREEAIELLELLGRALRTLRSP